MEYRRRRRRRKNGGSAIKAVLSIMLVAGAIYIAASFDIGGWVSDKLVEPVRETFGGVDGDEPIEPAPVTGGKTVTREVALPTIEHFGLQMGVFASLENAESLAKELTEKGAAGFIVEEASRYRVLASVYSTEADAISVRDRLRNDGVDCTLYSLTSPGIAFSVTATETQTSAIDAAFSAYADVLSLLEKAIIEFDSAQPAVSDGKEAVADIADGLAAALAPLSEQAEENEVLSAVRESGLSISDRLNKLIDSSAQTVIAFSAEMKYTHIWITNEYIQMIDRMKAK